MQELKLTAKDAVEQKVLNYLVANVSEILAAKINAGEKTLSGAMKYANAKAYKMDHEDSCVCVDDDTVYGWIIHFFEEDSITEAKPKPKVSLPKGVQVKPVPVPVKPVVKVEPQMSLFDSMTGRKPDEVPEAEEEGQTDPF
jgi:hypothetical protein